MDEREKEGEVEDFLGEEDDFLGFSFPEAGGPEKVVAKYEVEEVEGAGFGSRNCLWFL